MAAGPVDFAPTATLAQLERRATALAGVRAFFAARGIMEVDPPALINAPVTDVNLHSARVQLPGVDPPAIYALHTSPEYTMKRVLAAGSGDIYFLGHVYRGAERGRLHNPEFTLIEWYRRGFTLAQLMREVAQLVAQLCRREPVSEYISYREAFEREVGFDPLTAPDQVLRVAAAGLGLSGDDTATTRDELLDLIMGAAVGPRLGHGKLTFVQGYPASQAALAKLDPQDARIALRFELYAEGIELANGFDELADAAEQRARFTADQRERARRGLPIGPIDERLLAALAAGLPPCAGVAVGFDRVLMLAEGAERIDAVLPFTLEHA